MPSRMATPVLRALQSLDLEERILNAGLIGGIVGLFLPWLSGEWQGTENVSFNGFQFYTSLLGIAVFILLAASVAVTAVPLFGGPQLLKRKYREIGRLAASVLAGILTLAALSVLTNVTFEFSRVDVRLGIYVTLIGCIAASLEAGLRYREQLRQEALQETFHHPEDVQPHHDKQPVFEPPLPPPPPPPPPLEPEEHHVRM